jgi:hypothetical protein
VSWKLEEKKRKGTMYRLSFKGNISKKGNQVMRKNLYTANRKKLKICEINVNLRSS